MAHPYTINTINAIILILAGTVLYFIEPGRPISALVAPAFGILFLACNRHLRKHNRFVFYTITSLTLALGFLITYLIDTNSGDWSRSDILLLIMGLSCFISSVFYVGSFVRERRTNDKSIYKDDL